MVTRIRQPRSTPRSDRGATDVFMLILLMTLVMFAGLAFDVGMLFNAHRNATNIAAAAARSGADEVSTNALYQTGVAEIDEARARQAVSARIPSYAQELSVDVDDAEIVVRVRMKHEPTILSAFGFSTFEVDAEATARVANGAP